MFPTLGSLLARTSMLQDLPTEIIYQIAYALDLIAPSTISPARSKLDVQRASSLSALCLTCSRLRAIVLPVKYERISHPGSLMFGQGKHRRALFRNTLVQHPNFAAHVRYAPLLDSSQLTHIDKKMIL